MIEGQQDHLDPVVLPDLLDQVVKREPLAQEETLVQLVL